MRDVGDVQQRFQEPKPTRAATQRVRAPEAREAKRAAVFVERAPVDRRRTETITGRRVGARRGEVIVCPQERGRRKVPR